MLSAKDMRRAVEAGEFLVHYQPRLSTHNLIPEAAEALLRWNRPVPLDKVILKLEQHGLIHDVTIFVITTVCSHMRKLQWSIGYSPRVSINVSPILFSDPLFMDEARRVIESNEIPPSMIEFEITESRVALDISAASKMSAELRKEGFLIALDDFGTGYSGLQYLDMIQATTLKIDRHFIDGLGKRAACDAIVSNVARLALDTGLSTVAEGVETREQLTTVAGMGYSEVQGFLLAKPMPFSELIGFMNQFARRPDLEQRAAVAPLRNHAIASC